MQNLKNFLVAFGIGIVVFGLFAVMISAMLDIEPEKQNPSLPVINTDGETDNTDETDTPDDIKDDGFTAVIGGYDSDSGELDALIFFKADNENERFVVAAIPTALSVPVTSTDPATGTTVKTNVRIKDIPLRYRDSEKKQMIKDTVSALTGMKIDHYAFFSVNEVLRAVEKTGGLYYDIPEDMVYIGKGTNENPEINLKKGGKVLNAAETVGLLRFSHYTGDEKENNKKRALVQADFVFKAIEQIMRMDSSKIETIFSAVLPAQTDFELPDLKEHFDLLLKIDDYSANSVIMTLDLSDPLDYTYSQKLFENYK